MRKLLQRAGGRPIRTGLLVILVGCMFHCVEPPNYSGPVADWPHYGRDLGGLRYSPLTQIGPDNVGQLRRVWTYHSGDISHGTEEATRTSLQVTPIVVEDTLYFCTPFNRVVALDAETGQERWVFDPQLKLKVLHGAYPLTCRGVSTWLDQTLSEGEPAGAGFSPEPMTQTSSRWMPRRVNSVRTLDRGDESRCMTTWKTRRPGSTTLPRRRSSSTTGSW